MQPTPTSATSFGRAPRLLTLLLVLALGFGTISSALAQNSGIFDDYVILNNSNYKTNATNPPASTYPSLDAASLGSFDRNTGVLNLNGGLLNSYERNGDAVGPAYIYYRVYRGTTPANGRVFQRLNLPQTSTYTDAGNGTFNRVFNTSSATVNLVNLTAAPGSYTLEIYLQADATYNNGGGSGAFILYDTNGGSNFKASFSVTGTPQPSTTWTGAINANWFDPANWTNGMPTSSTDAIVPDFGPGSNTYPNIYSDGVSTAPAFDNTGSGPAQCKTLTLAGTSQGNRSICRLITGTLQVYGDFYNVQDSFIQRENTTLEFAGADQTLTGGTTFYTVVISGSGTKSLTGILPISTELHFAGGVLTTNINAPTTSYVDLSNRSIFNGNNGAQITGETDATHLTGLLRTTRTNVQANETDPNTGLPDPRTFGNMGLSLLFTTNDPGDIDVTRNTTESYNPLNNAYSIRRVFGVRPSNPQTNNGGLRANMTFRYLDSETMNLTPQGGSIPEANLILFVSSNAGNSFTNLGRTSLNTTTNELTRNGITTFATFTLGDQDAPLPVSLVAFDAKRAGVDAVLTWRTATETNNRGFEVQASADGREFHSLEFVASQASNSVKPLDYRYVEHNANQSITRYYRLRQVDLNGKETYSPVKAVTFEGQASLAAQLEAYPSPFTSDLHLRFGSAGVGTGQLILTDLTGRVLHKQTLDLTAGANEALLDQVAGLQAGIYVARLTLPSGGSTSVKVQKL